MSLDVDQADDVAAAESIANDMAGCLRGLVAFRYARPWAGLADDPDARHLIEDGDALAKRWFTHCRPTCAGTTCEDECCACPHHERAR